MAHGLSCSSACGIFPDQGSNPCPPHWQADSYPLRHQGSPCTCLFISEMKLSMSSGQPSSGQPGSQRQGPACQELDAWKQQFSVESQNTSRAAQMGPKAAIPPKRGQQPWDLWLSFPDDFVPTSQVSWPPPSPPANVPKAQI